VTRAILPLVALGVIVTAARLGLPPAGDAVRLSGLLAAQPPSPSSAGMPADVVVDLPRYDCMRARTPIRVDGVLDEAAWRHVLPTREFRLSHGKGIPNAATRLKACWDAQHLYLAFQCLDRDIFSPYKRRDQPLYEGEVVEAFLSPGPALRRYFEFEVSPANVIFDARIDNPGPPSPMTVDRAWNAAGLRTAVRVRGTLNRRGDRDRDWTVEMALPFADLGLDRPVRAGDAWRANFYRIDRGRPEEFSAWSPTLADPPNFHVPSRFGKLVFLDPRLPDGVRPSR
jgi:Carbohydrate-binding family 9